MTLAEQQHALLSSIFAPQATGDSAALMNTGDPLQLRGLQAYKSNAHASAERSLAAAFPTVQRILGEAPFKAMARAHWHAHPPRRGDLAQWGAELPAWLAQDDQLLDLPYISDVARLDWAMHRMQFDADVTPAPESFAQLSQNPDVASTHTLLMASGFALLSVGSAAGSIVLAHQQASPDWEAIRNQLMSECAEQVLLWRQQWRPRLQVILHPSEWALLQAISQGGTLGDALAAVAAVDRASDPDSATDFDFSHWLAAAVTDGLVLGLQPTNTDAHM